jgi:transposase
VKANIPSNPRGRRKPKRGRPYRFDEEGYRRVRSSVERLFAWLESFKKITIRCERLATTFLALIHIACILIYLRVLR